ncbi:MAG: ribonuclease E/G [Clostridia bacterium]|nr:ribonuclease E/G [Clostridia bacterium]
MRDLLIRKTPRGGWEGALVEDGHMVEFVPDKQGDSTGSVYLGIVRRLMPANHAVFVDFGGEREGYLPLDEANIPITRIQSGDRVIVQIRREAQGTKGAYLTRNVALAGSYVILNPVSRETGVSAKIQDEKTRTRLKEAALRMTGGEHGLVMRTSSADAPEEVLEMEYRELLDRWSQATEGALTGKPRLLLSLESPLLQLIYDEVPRGLERVIVKNDEELDARALLSQHIPSSVPLSATQSDPFVLCGAEKALNEALGRFIWLRSGASLVFDQCEAMTVIDVNTAHSTGRKGDRSAIVSTNLEACDEIARQLRLRNIGGMIVIDMIDMDQDSDRERVLERLREALGHDRMKCVVYGFTALGLIEMTRRRTSRSLRDVMMKPCHHCHGIGYERRLSCN